MNNASLAVEMLGPEVDAIDKTVSKPDRDVMGVIVLLSGDGILEGEIAGEPASGGAHDREKAGHDAVGTVLGEKLTADFDSKPVFRFGVGNLCRERGGSDEN